MPQATTQGPANKQHSINSQSILSIMLCTTEDFMKVVGHLLVIAVQQQPPSSFAY